VSEGAGIYAEFMPRVVAATNYPAGMAMPFVGLFNNVVRDGPITLYGRGQLTLMNNFARAPWGTPALLLDTRRYFNDQRFTDLRIPLILKGNVAINPIGAPSFSFASLEEANYESNMTIQADGNNFPVVVPGGTTKCPMIAEGFNVSMSYAVAERPGENAEGKLVYVLPANAAQVEQKKADAATAKAAADGKRAEAVVAEVQAKIQSGFFAPKEGGGLASGSDRGAPSAVDYMQAETARMDAETKRMAVEQDQGQHHVNTVADMLKHMHQQETQRHVAGLVRKSAKGGD
jgi:hypothetical protein